MKTGSGRGSDAVATTRRATRLSDRVRRRDEREREARRRKRRAFLRELPWVVMGIAIGTAVVDPIVERWLEGMPEGRRWAAFAFLTCLGVAWMCAGIVPKGLRGWRAQWAALAAGIGCALLIAAYRAFE